jgi:hypothetical protein
MGVLPAIIVDLKEEQGVADEVLMEEASNLGEYFSGADVRHSRMRKE